MCTTTTAEEVVEHGQHWGQVGGGVTTAYGVQGGEGAVKKRGFDGWGDYDKLEKLYIVMRGIDSNSRDFALCETVRKVSIS